MPMMRPTSTGAGAFGVKNSVVVVVVIASVGVDVGRCVDTGSVYVNVQSDGVGDKGVGAVPDFVVVVFDVVAFDVLVVVVLVVIGTAAVGPMY